MKLIKNVNLILEDRIIENGGIIFTDRIEKLLKQAEVKAVINNNSALKIIDGGGNFVSPGLIDIHIHGAHGHDTMDATYEAINDISKALIQSGVTSFLPTTMTLSREQTTAALKNIRETRQKGTDGATVLGAHCEGPFFNPQHKGAQLEEDIISPELELFAPFMDIIKHVSLAPEMEGADKLIERLHKKKISISAAHTGASYDEIIRAIDLGLSHATHLFNGMIGLHHRKPGVVGAVLSTDMSCELICDFIHLHPAVIKLVLRAKGADKVLLVTDQMKASFLPEGEYELGGQKVIVKDGACRLESGSLAGSILTLNQAIKNITKLNILSLPEIVKMATLNPARLLGLSDHLGLLAPGYQADLILFNKEIEIQAVYIKGKTMAIGKGR